MTCEHGYERSETKWQDQTPIWDEDYVTLRDREVPWMEYSMIIPEGRHEVTFLFLQGPKEGGPDSSLWLDEMRYERIGLPINLSIVFAEYQY